MCLNAREKGEKKHVAVKKRKEKKTYYTGDSKAADCPLL